MVGFLVPMGEPAARHNTDEETAGLRQVVRDILAPLVEADGGELYLVSLDQNAVALHLCGRFAGCPGNTLTVRQIIEPAILAVAPQLQVIVTWGGLVPSGAERVRKG